MLTITARDAESFSLIEAALHEFDEQEVFLRYFDVAVQSEADVEGVTVILRNSRKFKKDLNKRKYIISIPTTMTIEGFEYIKKYETKSCKRVPFYSVLVKGRLNISEVNFILILSGFNDDAIRILSSDEEVLSGSEGTGEDGTTTSSTNSANSCGAKCPMMSNRQFYNMCHPTEHVHDCCPMPLMNCDEESFINDTLI